MYTAIHCSKCLFVHQCIRPQCLAIIATLLSLQMIAQLTAVVVAQRRAVEEVWGDRGQWQFHGHPVCSRSMQLVGNVCFYGDSIVLKWVLMCVFLCYQKRYIQCHVYNVGCTWTLYKMVGHVATFEQHCVCMCVYIRGSVDIGMAQTCLYRHTYEKLATAQTLHLLAF